MCAQLCTVQVFCKSSVLSHSFHRGPVREMYEKLVQVIYYNVISFRLRKKT